ncbi:AAA family ATPase [Butyrivibrio sp. MB2005]|uniref:AAA family ATPase n=1 Tax=Butyrivibrio sp. MB2005 TaxID=1280678 RepID=UPI0003F75C69|nr:ATP-binding protein [Butyrivibrio sp. MB2005]
MLTKFQVENFKNFKNKFVLDFTKPYNYEFNKEAISNDGNIISKGIIYGPNGSGKSNLGLAIFDIVAHLTDTNIIYDRYTFYSNLDNNKKKVTFKYNFVFDGHSLEYEYQKRNILDLVYEKLSIDDEMVVDYNFDDVEGYTTLEGADNLVLSNGTFNRVSRVKYIFSTAILKENEINSVFKQFGEFVNRMLLFYSLDNRGYQGFKVGTEGIADYIVSTGKVADFQKFLSDEGIQYSLTGKEVDGSKQIYCKFKGGEVNFFSVASTGTISLTLFYYWYLQMKELAFVYIDEFDAFYHFELAYSLVKLLKKVKNCQIVLTTHNTDLLTNDLLRPDCYFEINDNRIKCLADKTEKDIRKAHNLQKMYKAGVFNE